MGGDEKRLEVRKLGILERAMLEQKEERPHNMEGGNGLLKAVLQLPH